MCLCRDEPSDAIAINDACIFCPNQPPAETDGTLLIVIMNRSGLNVWTQQPSAALDHRRVQCEGPGIHVRKLNSDEEAASATFDKQRLLFLDRDSQKCGISECVDGPA